MAATSLSSSPRGVTAKIAAVPRSSSSSCTQLSFCSRHLFQRSAAATTSFNKLPLELILLSSARNKHARTGSCPATDNDQAAAPAQETTAAPARPLETDRSSAEDDAVKPGNGQPQQPGANGSPPKRAPLTARERLRAARVLGRYAAEPSAAKGSVSSSTPRSSTPKPEFGKGVLDALREADAKKGGGGRRRSRLPEAPGNLLDDSKRGMPKDGWTWELPFGVDVFLVLVSFTLISTIMFGTVFLVWKLGAIHFNEY